MTVTAIMRPFGMLIRGAWFKLIRAKVVSIAGVKLRVDHPALSPKMRLNLQMGHYEAHEQQILNTLLTPKDRVLEVGAGVGFLSLLASSVVPGDQIVAVEANPKLIDLIETNQQLNNTHFRLIHAVLGKGDGTRNFFLARNFWASSLEPHEGREKVAVPQRDFQTLLDDCDPTVLIMDIEGGEAELLQQADLRGVQTILLELHPAVLAPPVIGGIFARLMANGLYPDLGASMGYVYVFRRAQMAGIS